MSYEKLGFTKGQTLKAEHLNHMEEGIYNNAGFISWTGEVAYEKAADGTHVFTWNDLGRMMQENDIEEVEIGIEAYTSSSEPNCTKYSFVCSQYTDYLYPSSLMGDYYPSATLRRHDERMWLTLAPSYYTGAVPVVNPQILFVRLYKRG